MEKDPVCGMLVAPAQALEQRTYEGTVNYFCSPACAAKFEQAPERFIAHDKRDGNPHGITVRP